MPSLADSNNSTSPALFSDQNIDHQPDDAHNSTTNNDPRHQHYLTSRELKLFASDDTPNEIDLNATSDALSESSGDYRAGVSETSAHDPLAALDGLSDDEGGEICELHVYENRYNSNGFMINLQVGAMDELPTERRRNPHAALVVERTYTISRTLQNTLLEIRSPHMRKAMKSVIGTYPGVNLDAVGMIQISGANLPYCLFHYRHQLQEYAQTSEDDDFQEHMNFLLRYIAKTMQKEITSWQTLMESNEKKPGLDYADLWMAFVPGDLLFSSNVCPDSPHILRLKSMQFEPTESSARGISPPGIPGQMVPAQGRLACWLITCETIDCNGEYVSYVSKTIEIPQYAGYCALVDLPVYPLKYHANEAQLRDSFLKRGKDWLSLVGVHHRSYTGSARVRRYQGGYGHNPMLHVGVSQPEILPVGFGYLSTFLPLLSETGSWKDHNRRQRVQ